MGKEKSKKRKRSRSVSSSSGTCSTDSSQEKSKLRKLKKKLKKEQKKAEKTLKKKLKEERRKNKKKHKNRDSGSRNKSDKTQETLDIVADVPVGLMEKSKAMAPMTKEEWEKRQSIVRRVLDEDTGRYRLIKGDGEVLEEIVSRDRHKQINRLSTQADGAFFQSQTVDKKQL